MAITFSPASHAFGDVVIGQPVTKSVTITNDGSSDVVVTGALTPFSMTPPNVTVPAATAATGNSPMIPGSVTVSVTYSPGAATSHQGSLSAGGVSCQLTGTGVMSSADAEVTFSPKKALFINVPDFSDGVFEAYKAPDAVHQTMTSFLRLGTFDYNTEPPNARALLKLMHQAGPPGNPNLGTNPAWGFDPASQELSDAPPFKPRASDAEANAANTREVIFLDDVRIRDVDITSPADDAVKGHGLTRRQRQDESSRLYSRGGWRDHSDGNRITTTYGDKVEIIRGNYKMIIMGRQDNPGEAMGWDVGGSHVTDYAPGTMPGATFWHEWIPDYQFTDTSGVQRMGVWLLVNTTEGVYQYARNAGTFKQEQWGDLIETYVGSENPPSGSAATDEYSGTQGHGPPTRLANVKYDLPSGTTNNRAGPPFNYDNKDVIRSNPHIVEKTWAKRIDSWTGSEDWPIPHISEKTFANYIESETGNSKTRVGEIHEKTWAKQTFELVDVSAKVESNTRAGSIFEATTAGTIFGSTTAATIQEITTAVLHTEVHAGGHISLEGGVVLDVFAGAKLEISIAATKEIDVFKKKITMKKLNVAMRDYVLAVTSTTNTMQDERTALRAAVKALDVRLGM